MLVNKGQYGDALHLLKPVLQNYPQNADILYDTAIVACLVSGKDHSAAPVMGLQWDVLLKQMLRISPNHAYTQIAHQLLANQDFDTLPLVLNRRIQARRPPSK